MGTVEPYELKGLQEEKSWALFKSLAFKEGKGEMNPNLTRIGKEIVRKCRNVPLAIRTIAGILYSRDTEEEWVYFRDREFGMIELHENDIMPTVKLSYDHLSPQQKQCFAYCSVFPKDYKFEVQRLIWLWMAQGFVKSLDEGHACFMELLRRCFFQNVVRDVFDREICCQMHDLMHDLAKEVGGECLLVDGPREKIDNNIRHVQVMNIVDSCSASKPPSWLLASSQVRSYVMCADLSVGYSISNLNKVFSCLRHLRTLDLGETYYDSIPDSIEKLKHLRYFRAHVDSLPRGITRLQYLQTLDLQGSQNLRALPSGFSALTTLRHLHIKSNAAFDEIELIDMPPNFGRLKYLQTLDKFIVGQNNGLDALNGLNLSGELGILYKKHRQNVVSEATAADLKGKRLTSLALTWSFLNGEELVTQDDQLLECLQPPSTLKALSIKGWEGVRFPSWGIDEFPCLLPNLVDLRIQGCRRCQHLPAFSRLPHLKILLLGRLTALAYVEASSGSSVATASSSRAVASTYFPSLQILNVEMMPELKEWSTIDCVDVDGQKQHHQKLQLHSFPHLSSLRIQNCRQLMSLPRVPTSQSLFATENLGMLQEYSHLEKLELYGCETLDLWDVKDDNSDDGGEGKGNSVSFSPWHALKSLHTLRLERISNIESLPMGIGGLTALQELEIICLPNLKTLPESIGQLIQLHSLDITSCRKLEAIPKSIRHLIGLQRLYIHGCPQLARRCASPVGKDWPLIQHISVIDINDW